jgi:metal-dependent HD superfamily phosphatase/phosphodiesterase
MNLPKHWTEQERSAALEAALREIANIVNTDNHETLAGAISIASKVIERICK